MSNITTRPSLKRYINIATKRQEAHAAKDTAKIEKIENQFWATAHKVTDYYGITAVREAEIAAGIKESNRAWS